MARGSLSVLGHTSKALLLWLELNKLKHLRPIDNPLPLRLGPLRVMAQIIVAKAAQASGEG